MKILALSDKIIDRFYTPQVTSRFKDVDIIISCGDLSYYYLEFILTILNTPLYYVRGNHDKMIVHGEAGSRISPHGGENIHRRVVLTNGLLLAGVEGSLRYKSGPFQYSQGEMWWHVFRLIPPLLAHKILKGKNLDLLITHAPPRGIHDKEDHPHRGISAFRWLLTVIKPRFHLHGHVHLILPDEKRKTLFGATQVINAYGYHELMIDLE